MKGKRAETITIKATPEALSNFRQAAAIAGEKQYKIIQEASEDVLKKICDKIKQSKNAQKQD